MADVVLSAKMSDSELLKSIETTLNKSEAKFNSFADNANKKLNSIGAGLGANIASTLDKQLNSIDQRLNAINSKAASISMGGSSSVVLKVDDFQNATIFAKELAVSLKSSADSSEKISRNLKNFSISNAQQQTAEQRINTEIDKQNLNIERQRRLKAQLADESLKAAAAESKNRIAIGGSSYDNAMKMNSASIQDRIEKIKALQTVQRNLSNTDVDYNSKLASINRSISALNNENKKAISSGVELEKRTNKLADSFNNLTRRVIYYTALGFSASFMKDLVGVRAEYEMLERSFGVLLDSFQNGSKVFAEIQANALKSPFSVIELTSAAKQLIAYNFTQKEVVDTTKRLGDVSAALGVPMERIVYNLGQIRAQTVLTARDARDFANAGLPMISNLAKLYTEQEGKVISTGEVYDRMTKKMVTYNDVMKVFNNLTNEGGMFFDYQAKQAETLKGQLSNLKDAYDQMLNSMGKDSQGAIELPIKALRSMFENWKEVTNVLGLVIGAYGGLKAKMIIQNALFGAHNAAITKSIMFDKIHKASMLEKKALYETLSTAELRAIATNRTATAADYQRILSTQGITKAQAIRLIAMNQGNVALKAAIINEKILTVAQANSATKTMALGLSFKNLGLSIKAMGEQFALTSMALLTNPFTYIILGLVAAAAAIVDYTNRMAEIKKFNNDLVDSTKESIDDINAYIKENQPSINLTMTKTGMDEEESIKFWESLRGEIEKTTTASDYFMQRLLPVSDINERNRQAIALLETIRNTGNIMANFSDNEIALNQDIMWGLGGEGLISDLKDATDYLKDYAYNTGIVQGALKESTKEVGVFADNLKKAFNKNNISGDAVVVALRSVMDTLEKDNDKLKGDVKDFFEIELEKQFELTNTLWGKYIDGLAQYGINSVKDYENKSEDAQKEVREKGLADFKKRMPQYYDAMAKMVNDVNNNLVMHIRVKFNEGEITNFQKEFDKRIQGRSPEALDVYRPTSQENLTNWTKAQQDAIKSVDEQIKNYQADLKSGEGKKRGWAKKQIEELEIEKAKRKAVLTIFNQSYESEKNLNKERRKGEGELSKTIKSEIDLINKLTSNYDKLTKAGMTGKDAIAMLGDEYGNTLNAINNVLKKYSLKTFSIEDFAGKDISKVLDLLKVQRAALPKGTKLEVKKAYDVEIEKLNVSAKTTDISNIVKDLESKLTNIKAEYELSIELQENEQVGNIFASLFNIDTNRLAKTAQDVVDRMQDAVNDAIKEYNARGGTQLDTFNIISDNTSDFAKRFGLAVDSDIMKPIITANKQAYDFVKKALADTAKDFSMFAQTASYEKQEVDKNFNNFINILALSKNGLGNDKYQTLLQQAIDGRAKIYNEIEWKYFQQTADYQKAFGNLDSVSTQTLQRVYDIMNKLRTQALNSKDAEHVKIYTKQMEDLFDKISERGNVFTVLKTRTDEYNAALVNYMMLLARRQQIESIINNPKSSGAEKTKAAIALNKIFGTLAESMDNLEDKGNKLDKAYVKAFNAIKEFGNQAVSVASKMFGDEIGSQIQTIFNFVDALGEAIKFSKKLAATVINTSDKIAKAMSTMEKASVILAVISAFMQIYNGIMDTKFQKEQEEREYMQNLIDLQREYNKTLLESKMLHNDVFGSNQLGNIMTDINVAQEAMQKYIESATKQQKKWFDPNHNWLSSLWGSITNIYAAGDILDLGWGDALRKSEKEIDNWAKNVTDGYTEAINNLRYITQKGSKGFLGIGSKGTKTTDLTKWVKDNIGADLFDKNGIVNLTVVDELLNKHAENLTDDTKNTLQELKQYAEIIKEVESSITEWATNVYGDLSSNLSSALVESFKEGTNAAESFQKYCSQVFENLGQQMIQNMLYKDVFGKYQDQLESLTKDYSLGKITQKKYSSALALLVGNMAKDAKDSLPALKQFMEELQKQAKENGLSIWGAEGSSTALSSLQQGIQGVTETTAGAIEGYMNNLTQQNYLQSSLMQNLVNNSNVSLGTQSQMLLQLQQGYQVQLAIQGILQGWGSNSGRSVKVQIVD